MALIVSAIVRLVGLYNPLQDKHAITIFMVAICFAQRDGLTNDKIQNHYNIYIYLKN